MTTTPAGWYPDPYGSPLLRWWDGTQWTDATHPLAQQPGQPPQEAAQPAQFGTAPQGQSVPAPPTQPLPRWQTEPHAAPPGGPAPGSPASGGPASWGAPGQPGPQTGPQTVQFGGGDYTGPQYGPASYQGMYGSTPYGEPPRKRPVLPAVIAAVVVVVLLVAGGVTLFLRSGDGGATAQPQASPTAPLDSTVPPEPDQAPPLPDLPQPAGGRITDPVTGLSYAYPGSAWQVPKASDVDDPRHPELPLWTSGCQAMSQQNYDGKNNDWVGSIYTAALPQIFPYNGPGDLRQMTSALLAVYEPGFYQPKHERKVLRNEALKVDGHQAWVVEFDMDFSAVAKASGWKWKTERGAFVLVDRGQGQRPALLYVSVPDNLDQSVIKHVMDSLQAG